MRIAAIYIEEHEYLFEKPQTINFGGKYFYNFKNENNNVIVSRNTNEDFIEGFFDLTALESKVTNINALVGQNGAGKSTILDIIRSKIIENEYALPRSKSVFLVEIEGTELPLIFHNDFNEVYIDSNSKKAKREKLKREVGRNLQTIYYSPHYDYKFNPRFDEVDNHDISFDKILEKDLAHLNEMDTDENGWPYSPSQELLFKNSIRQIEFLSSKLVTEKKIFQDLFHLQNHYEPILHFRGYKDIEKEWNTPSNLRRILKTIVDKLEEERQDWTSIRKIKNKKVVNQVEINQYLLKKNVIDCILSLIYRQMERKNSFLQEGYFPYDKFEKELEKANALDTFILFVENSSLKINLDNEVKLFDDSTVKDLVIKIYDAIENTKNVDSVTNNTLMTSPDNVIEILQLQRKFLNDWNKYYYKFHFSKEEIIIHDDEKINEFINYMPFSRRLSSGENSLLNLFSRIYNFLHLNLKTAKSRQLKNHYILLLDEADLTFHLSWKKRYVKALLKTLPHFFNELENTPTIQIIFTTHDPLALSDLPNSNVIYIERKDYYSPSNILDYNNLNRPSKTFGANISDLISDSFFIENSLIGDFSFDKIRESIEWLNNKKNIHNAIYHKKLINMIDEPIVQRKLAEMYDDKMETDFQVDILDEQIQKLEKLRKKLKG